MKKVKDNLYMGIPYVILIVLLVLFIADSINTINTVGIQFDDAYNAQVASNFARTGIYKVSYPKDIVFYNIITTGQNVLLVTAFLYKVFGISAITTEITALIYSVASLIAAFFIFKKLLAKYLTNRTISNWLSIIGLAAFMGCASSLNYTSTSLLGESCALFFMLLSFLCIKNYDNQRILYVLFAGIFASSALIAKTICICLLVTTLGILLFEIFIRSIPVKSIFYYIAGIIIGILIWDSFKWWQLDKSFSNWAGWWLSEVTNAQNQSGTTSFFQNCTLPQIIERYNWVSNVLFKRDKIQTLILLISPFATYFVSLIMRFKNKSKSSQWLALYMMGLGGESLILYVILFGSSGLIAEPRRLCIYANCLWIFNLCILLMAVGKLIISYKAKEFPKRAATVSLSATLLIIASYSFNITNFYSQLIKKDSISEQATKEQQMSQQISNLPDYAKIYTYGWWQAPELSLLTQKQFHPETELIDNSNEIDWDATYFVVGNFIHLPSGYNSIEQWLKQYCDADVLYKAPNPYENSKGHTNPESNTIYKLNKKE